MTAPGSTEDTKSPDERPRRRWTVILGSGALSAAALGITSGVEAGVSCGLAVITLLYQIMYR